MDTEVIVTRLQKLDKYLNALQRHQRATIDEYKRNEDLQAIVERRLQLCAQACIDIANHLIAQLGLDVPADQVNVFLILGQEDIISLDLAKRLTGLVSFRNILVHDYTRIDGEVVYLKLQENLGDFEAFAQAILARYVTDQS